MPVLLLREFLDNIFLEGKRRTDLDLIYEIGNPTLGALTYLHVGFQLTGIWIETRNGSGSSFGGIWEFLIVLVIKNGGHIRLELLMLVI